jgi:hypothetical protein
MRVLHKCKKKIRKKKQPVTDYIPINGIRKVPPSFKNSAQKYREPQFKWFLLSKFQSLTILPQSAHGIHIEQTNLAHFYLRINNLEFRISKVHRRVQ